MFGWSATGDLPIGPGSREAGVDADHKTFGDVAELVSLKRSGAEHGHLPHDLDTHHQGRWPQLEAALAQAEATTSLPETAPNGPEVDAWLVSTRLRELTDER